LGVRKGIWSVKSLVPATSTQGFFFEKLLETRPNMRVLRKITNKLGVVDVVVVPDVRCGVCQLVTVNEVSSCFFFTRHRVTHYFLEWSFFCSTWSGVRVSRVGGKRCRLRWNSSGCDSDSRRRLGDLRVCNACVCIVNHT